VRGRRRGKTVCEREEKGKTVCEKEEKGKGSVCGMEE
jgi:hypothetical protein